jgi:hypothetical protein
MCNFILSDCNCNCMALEELLRHFKMYCVLPVWLNLLGVVLGMLWCAGVAASYMELPGWWPALALIFKMVLP